MQEWEPSEGWPPAKVVNASREEEPRPRVPVIPAIRKRLHVRAAHGQALVELATVLPLFLLLVAVALDAGRMFYSQITLIDAAREGALEAAANPSSYLAGQPCDKVTNRVICRAINESTGSFVGIQASDITMTCNPSCATGLGNRVILTVQGRFDVLTPLLWPLLGRTLTLGATADAQIETPPTPNAVASASPSPSPSPTPSPTPTATPSATASPTPTPTPCAAPSASFSISPASGSAYKNNGHPGTTFQFTDNSTTGGSSCSPVWSWNFGDGAGASSQQSPSYVYHASNTTPGFTVTLVLTTSGGTSTATYVVSVAPS